MNSEVIVTVAIIGFLFFMSYFIYITTHPETTEPVTQVCTVSVGEGTVFDLIEDKNTGILYIKNYTYYGYYTYTPYYGEHGRPCKYVGNEIVEVGEDNVETISQ